MKNAHESTPKPMLMGKIISISLLVFVFLFPDDSAMAQVSVTEKPDTDSHQTIGHALSKLPGFYLDSNGMLDFRGMGAGRLAVTMNGNATAPNAEINRFTMLSAFSADAFHTIKVNRMNTPSAWATPLGIGFDLLTLPNVDVAVRSLQGSGGIHTFSAYSLYGDLGGRAFLNYADRPSENVTFGLNASFQSGFEAFEQLDMNYVVDDFQGAPTDFLGSVSPFLQIRSEQRMSGSFWTSYVASPSTTFHFTGGYYWSAMNTDEHRRMDNVMGDWINPGESGAIGAMGFTMYQAFIGETKINQLNVAASGTTTFSNLELGYGLNWSRSGHTIDNLTMPFRRDGLDFLINFEDRSRPFMEIENIPTMDNGTVDYRNMRLSHVQEQLQDNTANQVGADFNLKIPGIGVNAGLSAKRLTHDGFYEQGNYTFFQVLNLYRFFMIPQGSLEVFGQSGYLIPWLVDRDYARSFFKGNLPRFNGNAQQRLIDSEYRNYDLDETLLGTFLSWDRYFGSLQLSAGLRYEHTAGTYNGNNVYLGDDNVWVTEGTSDTNSYGHLFPYLKADVLIIENLSFGASYNRGIKRPDFFYLAPFSIRNEDSGFFVVGNPTLKPELTDNINVGFRWAPASATYLRMGGFYSILSNAITETIHIPDPNLPQLGWKNSSNDISIYGFESEVGHRFSYLPGILNGLGLNANYSWNGSAYKDEARGNVRLPGQREHVLNTTVSFEWGRFLGNMSYQYSSGATIAFAQELTTIPSEQQPVYLDLKETDITILSASVRFRISSNFTFWADAWNLLNQTRTIYQHSNDLYPANIRKNNGFTFRTGVGFQF